MVVRSGTGLGAADNLEVGGDGGGAFAAVLDDLNEGEKAEERAGLGGFQAGGRHGRGERGQDDGLGAVAGLGIVGGVGAGEVPGAHGRQPGFQDKEQPAGIGQTSLELVGVQSQREGDGGQFEVEVAQPDDLAANVGGVITVMFHVSLFFLF